MITIRQKGDFSKTLNYLGRVRHAIKISSLERYGQAGVDALASATPVDSGYTSESWYYEIERTSESATIHFLNRNVQNGVPIAIILQYGHATKAGGWIEGIDYINPAIKPVFDRILQTAWKEVKR